VPFQLAREQRVDEEDIMDDGTLQYLSVTSPRGKDNDLLSGLSSKYFI